MKLSDFVNLILVQSGEFIVGSLEDIEFDQKKFLAILNPSLAYYKKFKPTTNILQIQVSGNSYTFKTNPPDWISKVLPTDDMTPLFITTMFNSPSISPTISLPWRYDKPVLQLGGTISGSTEITAHWEFIEPIPILDSSDKIVDYDLSDISYSDDKLFDLVRGKFQESLGLSRRMFTLNDLPVTMDSDSLISEGKELQQQAKDSLEERNAWHLAIGG